MVHFHEIAEAGHRILTPLTAAKLRLLGGVCGLQEGQRQLDLCCGKGELLCTWSRDHGICGVGVDLSAVFLAAARQRAAELGVADRVRFVQADARSYRDEAVPYDLVSCIGASWIGGGLTGTLDLLRPLVRSDGLILIGEPYWITAPSPEAEAAQAWGHALTSLVGILNHFEEWGADLVEMVLADDESWDRYEAARWWTMTQWLRDHPDHPEHAALREFLDTDRRSYLAYGRHQLGWGVFVLQLRERVMPDVGGATVTT